MVFFFPSFHIQVVCFWAFYSMLVVYVSISEVLNQDRILPLPPAPSPPGHLTKSRDIFGSQNLRGRRVLLVSNGDRDAAKNPTIHTTASPPPPHRTSQSKVSIVLLLTILNLMQSQLLLLYFVFFTSQVFWVFYSTKNNYFILFNNFIIRPNLIQLIDCLFIGI